ncbi:TIGR01777 family oxidoreductase [Frigoriglobus tundricola]|nr:TIGR01777 family oxidoreductase [Frigoriglobus tundricola]
MPVSAEELYAWHARPLAFQRLQPPWEDATVVNQEGTFGTDGYRVTVRAGLVGPVSGTWVAELYDFRPGQQFQDRELQGPFAFWNHTHRFVPDTPTSSVLEDHIEYRLPFGRPGRVAAGAMVEQRLAAMFAYRHALTASDLRRHAAFAHRPRLTVAVTGSRGLIGSDLVSFLTTGGHKVVRLVTGSAAPPFDDGTKWVPWKPDGPLPEAALDGVDAVVHLAGDNVADGRWSAEKKKRILESRTGPTRNVAQAIAALPAERRPKVFVCASAVGFYGTRGDEELTEDSSPGTGFFPGVVRAWEGACAPARDAGVRTVNLRIGVALSPKGGALGKQLFAFKMGTGAVLGSGKQWQSWVTVNDIVGAIHHALYTDTLSGSVNAVGPNPVTNREFTKALGRVLNRPAFFWLPRPALRVLFGEVADEALLASTRVRPAKLVASGFHFDHTELEPALRFLLGRHIVDSSRPGYNRSASVQTLL